MTADPLDRLLALVHPEPNSGCWLFVGALDHKGYGKFWYCGRSRRAHRVSFELLIGKPPRRAVLDHKCRTRCCVNPEHLDAVTPVVNTARGESPSARHARQTTCLRGHDLRLAPRTTRGDGRTFRRCLACTRERRRAQPREK